LKAFLVEQLDAFYFEPIRNNKKIMVSKKENIFQTKRLNDIFADIFCG